jgi:hypothetical protein
VSWFGRHEFQFETLRPVTRAIREPELHRLACYLFERPQSATHNTDDKPFAVDGRVRLEPTEFGTMVSVTVRWFDPVVDPRPMVEVALGETPHLGRDLPLRAMSWTFRPRPLPSGRSVRRNASVDFVTPTTMKTGRGRVAKKPTGAALLRSVSRRYSQFVQPVPRWVAAAVEDVAWAPAEWGHDWFTGRLRFRVTDDAPSSATGWLERLLAFAELSGVGSAVRSGRGTLEVVR